MASSGKSPGMLMRNAGIFNPVLVQAVGLCPVVAMATSVGNAALLAAVSAAVITLSEFIASLFLKSVPRWVRIGIYIILGAGIVLPFMLLIERINAPLFSSLGIYLPIMAVNSLNVLRCERFAVKISPFKALLDGITASIGYAAVLLVAGFFRELLGSGALLGHTFFKGRTLSGFLLPFGGFLVIGFASAALRAMIAKFHPKFLDKKQPKPGAKKKHHEPAGKPSGTVQPASVPEFAADESPFTLEEFDIITNEPSADTEADEQIAEPTVPEAVTSPETETAAETQPETTAEPESEAVEESEFEDSDINEESNTAEEESDEAVTSDEDNADKPFADLTLDDIRDDSNEKSFVSSDGSDDELEALMNRSISDILTKPKKEDEEE